MAKGKRLSKKQLSVIEDLFVGQLDEQAILDKHEVSRAVFVKWQMERRFVEEFNRRVAALNRQGELIIARYAPAGSSQTGRSYRVSKPGDSPEDVHRYYRVSETGRQKSG